MLKNTTFNLSLKIFAIDILSVAASILLSKQYAYLILSPSLNLFLYAATTSTVLLAIILTLRLGVLTLRHPINCPDFLSSYEKYNTMIVSAIGMLVNFTNVDALGMSKTAALNQIGNASINSLDNVVTRLFIALQAILFLGQSAILMLSMRSKESAQ
jgi:hypothetical protein